MKKELPSMSSRPLHYSHKIPILKTRLFWEKLKEGKVYATRCKKCGKLYYPPQDDCTQCLASDVEWVELGKTVTLETYTQVHIKPQGFTQYEPYTIAIARTTEGIKVMGWLEDAAPEDARVGMKLEMSTKTLPDGYQVIVFRLNRLGRAPVRK
ncbi:MAG: Zn-ribbon domain-containing OB-fold protein [Candidatus Geothermarchaeales archaeon]